MIARMRMIIAGCVLLSSSLPALAQMCDAPGKDIRDSIIRVAGDDGSYASGVVVGRNLVLTAAHVIEAAQKSYVKVSNNYWLAKVLAVDSDKDLALMSVPTQDLQPIRLSLLEPAYWQPVWAIGFPLAKEQVASPGNYEQIFNGALQTTAEVESGQSGGGLISCERGQYVLSGMVRGYGAYREGNRYVKLDDFSVAVAADDIRRFVNQFVTGRRS